VIATKLAVDDTGHYTGEMELYAYGKGKADAIREMAVREGISLEDSFAYSDSHTDLPMLEAVGHPLAVNPDRELAKIAAERGWEVLAFERPVTTRTRLAELPRPTPVVSGAALAGAIGSLALYWLMRSRRS